MVFATNTQWVQSIGQLHGTRMSLYLKNFDQSNSCMHIKGCITARVLRVFYINCSNY